MPGPSHTDEPTVALSETPNDTLTINNAPTRFGHYQLVEEVARGGMGVVYKARDTQLNRIVALKMILNGRFASEKDVMRFRQEAEAAANLDHHGIVPIYEIGEIDGHHFFSMKLIEGGSLSDHLAELRSDIRGIVRLLADVAKAVHHAHQRGILHRDLKPANIMLDESGKPLVTDLGLAKQIESDSGMTHTGAIIGTPAYMPPEQADGGKDVTTAADIYSLGAILYEALTGQPPHAGSSPTETLWKVMNDAPARPRETDRKIDATLELICLKCLERDPLQRYSSAVSLANDLECWLDNRPVTVRPRSLATRAGEVFRTNLRSAVGAAVVGVVAGSLLAAGMFSITFGQVVGRGRAVDPHALYSSFTANVPDPWFADLPNWIGLPGATLTIGVLLFTGAVVCVTTRPENGKQALAIGSVAGLMKTLVLFTLFVGFLATSNVIINTSNVVTDVRLLSEASFATPSTRTAAREEYLRLYPQLREVEEAKRPDLVGKKVILDATFAIPKGVFFGLLVSGLLGFVPCVAGTIAAQRIYAHQKTLVKCLFPYLELVFLVLLTSFFILGWELIHYVGMSFTIERPNPLMRCIIYGVVISLTFPVFKAWSWKWRYPSYGCVLPLVWLAL